jgi:murein DD-endopeptidase MepM/ murein hydrolase activator NlpD
MPTLPRYLVALSLSLGPAGLAAQGVAGTPQVAWRPRLPLQGSVVLLAVRLPIADSVIAVRGELAGEPLHFELGADGFRAVGAVPWDASDSVTTRVVVERAGGLADTVTASLPVGRRRVPRERLRVAPRFLYPPDSLAERIRAEAELVGDVRERAHDTPRLWRESFVRPRQAAVLSVFGVSRIFNGVVQRRHFGVDLAGQRGAPVRAANRGVVALVADLYFSGTTVMIDHGAGLVTGYLHLSRTLVAAGDTVDRGHLIGHVGASGRVTAPHLHWLAAYGDVSVDPLGLVTLDMDGPAW